MKMTTFQPGKGYPDNLATVYAEGAPGILALICKHGRTEAGRTVAQVRAENPDKRVVVIPLAEASERATAVREALYLRPWQPIEEESWHEALNCLPPEKFERVDGVTIFRMCEYTTGDITAHYAAVTIGGETRYFSGSFRIGKPTYKEHAAAVYTAARLFIGSYPCGVVFADRARAKGADYARLGFINYETLELEIEDDCPPECAALIREWCKEHMKPGTLYPVAQYEIELGTRMKKGGLKL